MTHGEETKRKPRWSTREQAIVLVLVLFLGVFVTFLGLIIFGSSVAPLTCGSFGATPCPGREDLMVISSTLNSPTNMTVQILNTGSVAIFLMSYSVQNANGRVYSNNNWSGPTIAPNAIRNSTLLVDGTGFTFQSGSYYTITLITTRNNQFTSTIRAS
jgi:hypothetical protein